VAGTPATTDGAYVPATVLLERNSHALHTHEHKLAHTHSLTNSHCATWVCFRFGASCMQMDTRTAAAAAAAAAAALFTATTVAQQLQTPATQTKAAGRVCSAAEAAEKAAGASPHSSTSHQQPHTHSSHPPTHM